MESKISKKDIIHFTILVAGGTIFSIAIGFLYFGLKVFTPKMASFQFLIGGLIGAIFYSTLIIYRLKDALYVLISLFLFHEIVIKVSTFSYFIRDFIYIGSISFAIYIFVKLFHHKLKEIRFGKFLIFASLFTVASILSTIILGLILSPSEIRNALITNVFIGSLLGIGLGLGLEISEILTPRILRHLYMAQQNN